MRWTQVLQDLTRHPATARFIAASWPATSSPTIHRPPWWHAWRRTLNAPAATCPACTARWCNRAEAWAPQPAKLKTPEEFAISSARLLQLGDTAFARQPDLAIGQMGQRVQAAPSPAGWPDRAEEWLGPDALWKRVEWATRVAALLGRQVDARALAAASLGPRLQAHTLQQIERAADGPQALALLLLAPEFQRR
jgi:uncharacterized protein (DUF1800 family)